MNKFILAASLAFGLIGGLAAPAMAADPVLGIWQTEVDDGAYAYVKFAAIFRVPSRTAANINRRTLV